MSQQPQQFDFDIDALIQKSIQQLDYSYCPYSNYQVGCALLTEDGTIVGGSNIENASLGLTLCAERSALLAALSNGHRSFKACVVATRDGGSCCGACRQTLREFFPPTENTPFVFVIPDGSITTVTTMAELLPNSFGPENLNIDPRSYKAPPIKKD